MIGSNQLYSYVEFHHVQFSTHVLIMIDESAQHGLAIKTRRKVNRSAADSHYVYISTCAKRTPVLQFAWAISPPKELNYDHG